MHVQRPFPEDFKRRVRDHVRQLHGPGNSDEYNAVMKEIEDDPDKAPWDLLEEDE